MMLDITKSKPRQGHICQLKYKCFGQTLDIWLDTRILAETIETFLFFPFFLSFGCIAFSVYHNIAKLDWGAVLVTLMINNEPINKSKSLGIGKSNWEKKAI